MAIFLTSKNEIYLIQGFQCDAFKVPFRPIFRFPSNYMICTQGQLLDISCVALSTILWLKPMLGMLSYFRTLMAMFDKSEVITLNCVFQMVHPGNALRFIFPSILLIHFYCFLCSCTSPCICMGILMALCVCRW